MKWVRKSGRIFDSILGVMAVLAQALIGFAMVSVLYEIGVRLLLGKAVFWVLQSTSFCLVFITFLGTAFLLKEEGHVKVDLILVRLSPRTQSLVGAITSVLAAITFLLIAWYGAVATLDAFYTGYRFSLELPLPQASILFIIPVGCFLLFIQLLRRAYGFIRGSIT